MYLKYKRINEHGSVKRTPQYDHHYYKWITGNKTGTEIDKKGTRSDFDSGKLWQIKPGTGMYLLCSRDSHYYKIAQYMFHSSNSGIKL